MTRIASALIVSLSLTPGLIAGDWSQFLGPGRDGVVNGQKLPQQFPAGGPREVWASNVGIGFGGASVRDDRVYLLDREEDARDVLRCLSLKDGKELWRTAYDVSGKLSYAGSRSTPTLDDKYIFTVGGFGHVHCFDRATGKILWGFDLREKFKSPVPNWGFAQSPLLYKDWVIVAAMAPEAGIVALHKATGEVAWKSPDIGGNTYASARIYKLRGKEQIVFIAKTGVSAVDPDNGKVLWSFSAYQNNIPIPHPLQIDDQRLFITGGYGAGSVMVRVDKEGEGFKVTELWKTPQGTQIHPAFLHEGHLFLNANTNETLKGKGDNAPGLICMNLEGQVKWRTNNRPSIDRGGMIVADGRAYMLNGQSGDLHLLELNSRGYKELATAKIFQTGKQNTNIWSPMSLSDGYLLLRDQQQLKCLDLRNNRQVSLR